MSNKTENLPPHLTTVDDFQKTIKSSALTVIHFSADWLDQCVQMNQYLDTLSKRAEFSVVQFYQVAAEELSEIALKFDITAVPTNVFFTNGKEIDRVNGADTLKVFETVNKHYGSKSGGDESSLLKLEDRLKELINKAKVMLFMKGTKDTPRCGFSKTIIQILNDTGVEYETFDILTDEEVRQGLKEFSDWPTYPQLYVKGELVGGLDIVKEMVKSGELNETLKA